MIVNNQPSMMTIMVQINKYDDGSGTLMKMMKKMTKRHSNTMTLNSKSTKFTDFCSMCEK